MIKKNVRTKELLGPQVLHKLQSAVIVGATGNIAMIYVAVQCCWCGDGIVKFSEQLRESLLFRVVFC
ncbi:MAG: hypothetical protein ACI89D_002464 [Bermanella sp.]|jgi:hypothetical protein